MADVDDIIAKWQRSSDDAKIDDVKKVVAAKIDGRAKVRWDRKKTSHVINISHEHFRLMSQFKGRRHFNVVVESGRRVRKYYLQDILDVIDALDRLDEEKKRKSP